MEYSGENNLSVMKLAKNYNKYLVDLVVSVILEESRGGEKSWTLEPVMLFLQKK